jgi:hypothetical protein
MFVTKDCGNTRNPSTTTATTYDKGRHGKRSNIISGLYGCANLLSFNSEILLFHGFEEPRTADIITSTKPKKLNLLFLS